MNDLKLEDVVKGLITKATRSASSALEVKINPKTGRFNLTKGLRIKFDFPEEIALSVIKDAKRLFIVFKPSDHSAFNGKRVRLGKTTATTLPDGFHSKELASDICKVFLSNDTIIFKLSNSPVFNMDTDKFWELIKKD